MSDPEKTFDVEDLAEWRKTEEGIEKYKNSPLYEESDEESPHGYLGNRRIIGRDTPINNGVYVGGGHIEREMIVVDDKKFSLLNETYEDLFRKRRQELISNKERTKTGIVEIMDVVYRDVLEVMPFSNEIADEIRIKHAGRKVSLDSFIRAKGGQCRQQALLTGYLLERMIGEGLINGQVSVQRNFIHNLGGHAWVKFTDAKDQVYIVDPALKFCGTLEQAKEKQEWIYEEPKKK